MSAREQILGALRQRERPFPAAQPPDSYRPMIPLEDISPAALRDRFVHEAEKAGCVVHLAGTPEEAIEAILGLVERDTAVSSWEPADLRLPGLAEALDQAKITRVGEDGSVRVGLTGVDAALAATGSVVVKSGQGRYRAASLLPPIHIAIVAASQVVPDLESWWAGQRAAGLEQFRRHSNVVVISGPSRTADIAMQLVMGMHGPQALHLVLFTGG